MLDLLPTLDPRMRDPKSTNVDQQPDYVLKGDYHYRSIKPEMARCWSASAPIWAARRS